MQYRCQLQRPLIQGMCTPEVHQTSCHRPEILFLRQQPDVIQILLADSMYSSDWWRK